jgi:pimeloyl-ACP methyl ester carboxylesterase
MENQRSFHSLVRKAGRIMLIIISVLLAGTLILGAAVWVWSDGKPAPFVDENGHPLAGSVSEKIWVNVNGAEQGMFIKSKDETNPVLLFLHGGGGMPEYFLSERYPTGLEEYFTVCWWERRGAGLSYRPGIPPETMTVEQMVADTLEVTNYLRHRFGVEKIYLMAHSGGSLIAIQAAAQAPELYHAYIGVSQMSYQLRSESLAYEYMLEQFKVNGNISMARKLERAPVTMAVPLPEGYMAVRDAAMHTLGIGTTRDMESVITGVFFASWLSRDYTIGEKVNIWRGKFFSDRLLWDKMLAMDLTNQVTALDLPVYFFHGIYDYTVSYPETRSYFGKLTAPVKGFYTFEQSAHSPMFEEPEKMRQIIQTDVLAGANSFADP